MPLVSVVYVSSAEKELTSDELKSMLVKIRTKNKLRDITGMLLYRGGNFLQVIEGPELAVDQLWKEIQTDSRHRGIILMNRRPIVNREFGEWQMAFRDLNHGDVSHLEGYSSFMELSFRSAEFLATPTLSYKLLKSFRQQCR